MKSYSHPATKQDLWVLEKFGGESGSFVELGGYDGVTHSNTLLLENLGWYGSLIEAHEPFYLQCKENRPNSAVYHVAIGDGTRQKMFVGGQYTGLAIPMPEEWREEHVRRNNETVVVQTKPLAEVIGTDKLDYLSLDTEGGEYEILENWFQTGGRCRLLTVEFRYDGALLMRLERLTADFGMKLDQVRGFDACFVEK